MTELSTLKELQHRIALYEDMQAYKQLYELFFNPLHRFSYSLIKSKEAAEEIVSDVFIKIWQMRGELNTVASLKVYLYVITKNFSLNYITKHFKHPIISLDEISTDISVTISRPDDELISAEIQQKIQSVINDLPSQCRIIFQLVKEDGLSYKEVASVLDLSTLTVRNQLAIAIKKIAKSLSPNQASQVLPAKFSVSQFLSN
jgi:RNA polymerase sigma-70 factor (ECF subfamily)